MSIVGILKKSYFILPKMLKKQVIWLAVIMLMVSIAELGLAGVVSLLGVAMASPESLQRLPILGQFLQTMPTIGTMSPTVSMLVVVLVFVVIATIVKNSVTAYMTYKQFIVSQGIAWEIGRKVFYNYVYAPYMWHTQQNTAELQNYLEWRSYVAAIWIAIFSTCTQCAVMLLLMLGAFIASPWVSLLLFGVCGSVAVLIYKYTREKVRILGVRNAELKVQASRTSYFALQGIREVHIYNQQESFREQYANFSVPQIKIIAEQGLYYPLPTWILESVGFIILLSSILLMQWQGESVATITGTLTLMAGISWRFLPAVNRFIGGFLQVKGNVGPAEQLIAKYLELPKGEISSVKYAFSKTLCMENVDFSYPKTTNKALENINITIKNGSMMGVVGLSGAGKSTLVGILTGLFSPTAGKFYIDEEETAPKPNFLNIGYVPQSPYIIDASLAENVAFSDWGNDIDEARVLECCRMAAMDFLDELPKGIHTILGDRGIRLSGGQLQRVAIARALYTKPDLLLFDEATSALDGAAEAAIQSTIMNLRKNMTIVIIAHRLSTVEGCDEIVWLHEGKIKQSGASAEVLSDYGVFLQTQSSEDEN